MKRFTKVFALLIFLGLVLSLAPVTQGQDAVTCESDVVVQSDDWLSKIAEKSYGDVLAYPAIFEATNATAATDDSYTTIEDANVIEPGWKLCIPSAEYAQSMLGTEMAAMPAPAAPSGADWAAPEGALVSNPVTEAPTLDGMADEAFWADAPAITAVVEDGANMGSSEVTLKSVYDDENAYFLVSWADPTESFMRSPWVKQDDGTWSKLIDPDDKGGDNNVYYEDKMSLIWNIDNSIPKFKALGCTVACHAGQNPEAKPYGNKYTSEAGQMGDIWHWKSVRNLGQVDDQYLDSTAYSVDTPSAGRHGDPKDGGGYVNNQTEDNSMPMWMGAADAPRDGSPGYILDADKQDFDDSLFAAGDMVPGIVKSQFTGDRGDISAGWIYADGVWTVEIARALETGSEYDVQFSDLSAPYYFGAAVFDNAQVRHAYERGSEVLVFKPADAGEMAMEETDAAQMPAMAADAPEGALVSKLVTEAPTLDGMADEAFWADAAAITAVVEDGANMGSSEVTIKSVYDDANVHFLVSWADPTESFMRSPWVKQDDGTWSKLSDPDDKGGDNNVYYEDKMSLIWNIDNSIPKFKALGCGTACHAGQNPEAKPFGNKYTSEAGQLGDIWHWKSVRNLGQVDDQYLDSTAYSVDTPSAGRHGDPSDGGGYVNNQTEDNSMPMWMGAADAPRDGSPGYILDADKQDFDDSLFAAGDMVPGIVKSQFTGDRGDISAGWIYADGVWTVEIARALETGSEYDVQFSDLSAPYYFGAAVFDNAQVRHAYERGSEVLVFEQ